MFREAAWAGLRDTNQSRIGFGGVVVRTLEDEFGSTETRDDTEALVYSHLEWFRYDDPELDVSTNLTLYSACRALTSRAAIST